MPIDVLKIDKSFIDDLVENNKKQTICQSIINMAKSLGIRTVAEGIEVQEQKEILMKLDVTSCRVYLFSKPLKKRKHMRFLENIKILDNHDGQDFIKPEQNKVCNQLALVIQYDYSDSIQNKNEII